MRLIRFYSFVVGFFLIHQFNYAQEITINGKVRDKNTHIEISAVNIFIKGTQIGTASDFAGRFSLKISHPGPEMIVIFQHIAYDIQEITLDSVKSLKTIYLQPRVIPLQGLEIEAQGEKLEIKKDLPQAVAVLESENFEIRGYADAGDFLRADHSVQVEEEMSGKKTVAIRGGNPDEVVVLYNGIKMNSAFDNIFDLSLIDLEDIERFEIIKGSNTALYGTGALAGVINVVPKVQQDYRIRVQQRIGTYRSGNWGIHIYQPLHRLHASYSYKEGATKRYFSGSQSSNEYLENRASHHTANLIYNFSDDTDSGTKNSISAMYIRSALNYDNHKDREHLSNLNQIVSLKYQGDIYWLRNLNISSSYHQLDENQHLSVISSEELKYVDRKFLNDSYYFNAEKSLVLPGVEFLVSYQFEKAKLKFQDGLDFSLETSGIQDVQLNRWHHGLVTIAKVHTPTGSIFMPSINFDISMRHDRVRNEKNHQYFREAPANSAESSALEYSDTRSWNETMFKFSSNMSGSHENVVFNAYMNYGTNVKFPTLFQQISYPLVSTHPATKANLNPEKNTSMEIGLEMTRNVSTYPIISGWQVSGNYFKNYYENKFRTFLTPGIPVAFYDNVQDAHITGLESKTSLFLYQKKIIVGVSLSRYFISEKAAFPFKVDRKFTLDFKINHAGYAFQMHLFKEGAQVGWVRKNLRDFDEIELLGRIDLDLHLSKTFEFYKFKLMTNLSLRNLLNNDVELAGLALRDRRIYLTMGIQY